MFTRRAAAAAAVGFPRVGNFLSTLGKHDSSTLIAEMNEEMSSIFGEPPPSGFNSVMRNNVVQQYHDVGTEKLATSIESKALNDPSMSLTHVDPTGEAQMVDISHKDTTKRIATASCKVILGKQVYDMVVSNQLSKGDVLTVAKIAGINGAKQTSSLIPLCHNITLTNLQVNLTLNPDDHSVQIEGEASSTGQTGVEMEAMTAVSIAGLTVYDMCKAASKDIQITNICLEKKSGGKSGYWSRDKTGRK